MQKEQKNKMVTGGDNGAKNKGRFYPDTEEVQVEQEDTTKEKKQEVKSK